MDIDAVVRKFRAFRDERDWMQFHNPKDMAAALAIEAAELQEIFLWKTGSEIEETVERKRPQIEAELADIAIYPLELVDILGANLPDIIDAKLADNALKYPIAAARGRNTKYSDL